MCRGEGSVVKSEGREGRCCVGSVARCGEGVMKSGGGRGDVWEGLGEVRRSVGEDVSICEERCGSVEKCCVGGVGKRWKTKKDLHGRRRSFLCTKSREDQTMVLHVSRVIAPFRPYFAFHPLVSLFRPQ